MQTTYSINQSAAVQGMLVSDSLPRTVESCLAKEAITVGTGVVKVIGKDDQVRLAASNTGLITFAGDLITANVVNLKVNGSAIAPVTFLTDHATTMGLLAVAIAALTTYVSTCTVSAARVLTVNGIDDTDIAVTDIVVTAGATQTTGTFAAGTRDTTLVGVALLTQALEGGLPGTTTAPAYPAKSVVNVLRQGYVWVYSETAFNPDTDTLYMRWQDGGAGKAVGQFRNTTDSSTCYAVPGNFKVRSTLGAAGLMVLELNKPV